MSTSEAEATRPPRRWRRRALLVGLALALGLPGLSCSLRRDDLLPSAPPLVWAEAPVFAVPSRDPTRLLAVYVADLPQGGRALSLVFSDEDQPFPPFDCVYDLFRSVRWGRVTDIETLELLPDALVFPNTAALDQPYATWFPSHHDQRVPLARLSRRGRRPVIYVRTWNHLFATEPEPGVDYVFHADVPLRRATRAELEAAARGR